MENKFLYNKDYGQCFLSNINYLNKISSLFNVKDQNVIEVGPGKGALTSKICEQNPKNFKIIEIDNRLIDDLKKNYPVCEVINSNCLEQNIDYKYIITNLPYSITNQFLIKLVKDYFKENEYIFIMLQKEVGDQIVAKPKSKNYGFLSVILQIIFDIKLNFYIPPSAFTPQPKVHSCFLTLKRKNNIQIDEQKIQILKKIFKNSNQKIKNTITSNKIINMDLLELRPSQLSPEQFYELLS